MMVSLSGCSITPGPGVITFNETPYISDPKSSEALNIARAGGLAHVKDKVITQEEAKSRGLIGPSNMSDGTFHPAFILGHTGVTVWQNALGIANAPLAALNILSLARRENSSSMNSYLGWAKPLDNEEKSHFFESISTSILADVKTYVDKQEVNYVNYFRDKYSLTFEGYSILNDTCKTDEDVFFTCTYGTSYYNRGYREESSSHFLGIIDSVNPDFIPYDKGTFFRGGIVDTVSKRDPQHDTLEMWTEVSINLPEHTYIYLAPGKYLLKHHTGILIRGGVPLILDHGEVKMFVTVEAES
jgi:hypothetical protein